MLYEIQKVKQIEGQDFRRWFTDNYFDLFVWYGKRGQITSFQLTYDKGHKERAVTYKSSGGITHTGVDDGEDDPMASRTPMLEADGEFDNTAVARQFQKAAEDLDRVLRNFISEKLIGFFESEGRSL